ncbi:hypothetical protein CALCODRAFT_416579, partial [Calocera cornea HHB12733]
YPPTRICLNQDCPHLQTTGQAHRLHDPRRYMAALYTVGRGAFPVIVTSLRCRSCSSTYHLNYYCKTSIDHTEWRVYYEGVPSVIKVRQHALFESKLCQLFRSLTVHSHSSFTATSKVYNSTLSAPPQHGCDVPHLQPKDIATAFDLYALLLHHHEQRSRLQLPESAANEVDRLAVAMEDRNRFMAGTGQEYWAHACDLCQKHFIREGQEYTLSCAITDGVSIGRPCCSVHNCAKSLPNNRARYCELHEPLNHICAIEDCDQPVEQDMRTCSRPDHRQVELNYKAVGQSFNLLKTRLQRATEYIRGPELLEPDTEEQLIVRPCGVILSRGTFYGAEALSSVADFLMSVFPSRKSLPDVVFYDNNCQLHRYIADRPKLRHHFQDTALVVDIFHYKTKHSIADEYCGRHCNALVYPELFDEEKKTWTFNSSACEQTNAWINNYQSIVREMLPVRYEFFLDEVIKERNRHIVEELRKRGHMPHLVPSSELF